MPSVRWRSTCMGWGRSSAAPPAIRCSFAWCRGEGTTGWICGEYAFFRSTQRSRTGKQYDGRGKGKSQHTGEEACVRGKVNRTMQQPQAIIFDLDGVLTDTSEYHYRAWRHLADDEKIPFTREENDAH